MRVGSNTIYRSMNNDLMMLLAERFETEKAVATGRYVNQPSDAPGFAVTILDSRQMIREVDQYYTNLQEAGVWMDTSESAMQSIADLLQRAKTLAEQMATGTIQGPQYASTATEANNIIAQLITLANTQLEGVPIFAGTRTDAAPISASLGVADPGVLVTDSSSGHGVVVSIYNPTAGDFRLQLTRGTTGAGATLNVVSSDLGGGAPIDFTDMYHTQAAGSTTADTYYTNDSVATATTDISSQAGEELVFQGDANTGQQTYRTDAYIDFPGAGPYNITIGGDVYNNMNSASELTESINRQAGDYMAILEDVDTVRIVSRDTGAFAIAGGGTTVTQNTNLTELQNDLNNGLQATGVMFLDGTDANFPPSGVDSVTLGEYTWAWQDINNGVTLNSVGDYANALSNWINNNADGYTASADVFTDAGAGIDGATIQITANAVGSAGNVALSTTAGTGVSTTGSMFGGMDGSDTATTGQVYIDGVSTLRLETTIRAKVVDVDDSSGDVSLRLRWYDDDNALQTQDVTISGDGSGNKVAIDNTGGLSIYINNQNFYEGSEFELEVSHYRGNNEDLAVNFNNGGQLTHNWDASEILGGAMRTDLLGTTADAKTVTGAGEIHLAGVYSGINSRDLSFDITDAGQMPGDSVTVRVTWTGDDGVYREESMVISRAGIENAMEVPGCDGVFIHLDSGDYDAGDSHHYKIDKSSHNVLDSLYEWEHQMRNGTTEEAQTQSQVSLEAINAALGSVLDLIAEAGTRGERITVRQTVLQDHEFYAAEQLESLQDVNLAEAFIALTHQQTAYNAALKTVTTANDMSLVELL